mmetsp:Transcript_54252/g.129316  ORF Transcript_54252/g.129316 Transcript_54252/m.129316 type:complete len:670 (+) Transcript_54252:127-2136(+)
MQRNAAGSSSNIFQSSRELGSERRHSVEPFSPIAGILSPVLSPGMGSLRSSPGSPVPEAKRRREEMVVNETEEWSQLRRRAALVLESHVYEVVLALVIVCNAFIIIEEVDMRARDEKEEYLESLSEAFFVFYVAEICFRLAVYRCAFFYNSWNQMDFSVVLLDAFGKFSELVFSSEVPSVSVLRILRLCRLARFLHILTAFRELHMMLHSFVSALRTIVFASIMLLVLLTLWSIVAVEVIRPVNERVAAKGLYIDCERCPRAFASVWETNLTFMQTIIAGDSWGRLAVPIIEEASWTATILVSAFVCINLGILNLILTVIVNAAQEARESDEKLRQKERLEKYQRQKAKLLKLLRALDEDGNGLISLEEMQKACDSIKEFRTVLASIDIRREDLGTFFSYLDSDGSGEVTYNEFVEQVFRIKSKDTVALLMSIKTSVSRLQAQFREIRPDMHALHQEASGYSLQPRTIGSLMTTAPSDGDRAGPNAPQKHDTSSDIKVPVAARTVPSDDDSVGTSTKGSRLDGVVGKDTDEGARFVWDQRAFIAMASTRNQVRLEIQSMAQRLSAEMDQMIGNVAARLQAADPREALAPLQTETRSERSVRWSSRGRSPQHQGPALDIHENGVVDDGKRSCPPQVNAQEFATPSEATPGNKGAWAIDVSFDAHTQTLHV